MAIIAKPHTFTAGATKSGEASQVNADYDTLYNEFNGNIDDANIKASAAIAQSKISGLANSLLYAAGLVAGTRMLFHQTAAPTGWTKDTTAGLNDNALRVVTGTVSPGGTVAFSTVMGTARATSAVAPGSTDGFTLTTAEIPPHNHNINVSVTGTPLNDGTNFIEIAGRTDSTNVAADGGVNTGGGGAHAHAHTTTHSHTSNLNVLYQDVIIASKD